MMDTTDRTPQQHGDEPDEAYDSLRAADPAASAEPDLSAIRAAVSRKVAASTGDEPAGARDGDGTPEEQLGAVPGQDGVADLAAARARRRPARWLQVAAAAVGVVTVGTAGYAFGAQGSDPEPTAGGVGSEAADAPALPVPAGPAAGDQQQSLGAPSTEESSASQADRSMIAPFGGMRTLFTAVGLGDEPGTATAYGYDSSAAFTSEKASAIASLVGLEGTPELVYGAWHLGSTDWTGPTLDVQPDAATSFYYSDPTKDPWVEGSTAVAVDGATATAQLADMMTTLGVDPAGYTLTVEDTGTQDVTTVTAYPVAGPGATGQTWQLSVSSEGIYSLSGTLAPLVDLGAYDVVGPTTAVARLTDPRFGATPDFSILEDQPFARADVQTPEMVDPGVGVDSVEVPSDDPAAVPTVPPTLTPGTSFSWPVAEVSITGAELTTTTVYGADGSVALVPAYRLTGDDGSGWTVVAVTEEHLDFAAQR
jgi:hypothetical protein